MPHDVSLITLFAVAFVLASVFGYIATRMRLRARRHSSRTLV